MTAEFQAAVHALVFLNHKGDFQSSEAIAENVCTNPARIRKILAKLEKAGFVEGKNGVKGGYRFAADPKTTNLEQVLDALKETLICAKWKSGDLDMDCAIASGMSGVMDELLTQVNASGREVLRSVTVDKIDGMLFPKS